MKSIIYSYQETQSMIDYEGKLTQLLFTAGCNFKCGFCHNADFIENHKNTLPEKKLETILNKAQENWVNAVCISGGEPTIHKKLPEFIDYLKEKEFAVKIDTNGMRPDILKQIIDKVDYVAMDFKTRLTKYPDLVNVPIDPEKIKQSIALIKMYAKDYEIRTTVIPGVHCTDDFKLICKEIQGVKRYILQPFVPRDNLPDKKYSQKKQTRPQTMNNYLQICKKLLDNTEVRIR